MLLANPVVPLIVQKNSYRTESHHAAASGRSRPSYAITRGRREAHAGDQRVVLMCGPNRPHQIRRPSPRSRSPPTPPSRSAIADLLEAGPSTQSRGPPPPLAVKKARCRGRGGGGWRRNLQGALSAHAGMVRLPRSDSWMQACASSLAPFLILHVQPWMAVYFSSPLPFILLQ